MEGGPTLERQDDTEAEGLTTEEHQAILQRIVSYMKNNPALRGAELFYSFAYRITMAASMTLLIMVAGVDMGRNTVEARPGNWLYPMKQFLASPAVAPASLPSGTLAPASLGFIQMQSSSSVQKEDVIVDLDSAASATFIQSSGSLATKIKPCTGTGCTQSGAILHNRGSSQKKAIPDAIPE